MWLVIEGKKIGTPRSYRLHMGSHDSPLDEAEITRFEYTKEETTVDFRYQGKEGKFILSNTSPEGRFNHGNIDEKIDTVYNFFGCEETTGMRPAGCDEYFRE